MKLSDLVSCVKSSLSIAPATTAEFRSALTVSDIVVTLVKPSSDFESETLTSVTEKIRTAQKANAARTVGAVHQNQLSETPPQKSGH